ncbi:MAG TPA: DNA recombination protein RmuC [Ktedonobacterales bacterium]
MPAEQLALYALGGAAAILLVIVLVLVGFLLGRRGTRGRVVAKDGALALPLGAEALAPAFTELRGQLAQVQEKVQTLGAAAQSGAARYGMEDQAWQAIQQVATAVAALDQVPGVQQHLQSQVADALQRISLINEVQRIQQSREAEAYTALQRLSAVLLGSATSGAAGERVVREMLSHLPAQWIITNHAVGGRRVEFAIKLPDNLFLPVDSKVVAKEELADLDGEADPKKREQIERAVRAAVLQAAADVHQYVDERTPGFALAAVPDAAYSLCGAILADAFQKHRALIVPYSLLGPFVLMVYEQHRQTGMNLDGARIARLAAELEGHLEQAQQALNRSFAGAITQLSNASASLGRELAAAAQALAQLRAAGGGSDGEQDAERR